jgi:two-component system NtrC family response regulator
VTDNEITPADIPDHILGQPIEPAEGIINIPIEGISLESIEKKVITRILKQTGGNRSQTARLLQIPRHVLLYKMKKLGLK